MMLEERVEVCRVFPRSASRRASWNRPSLCPKAHLAKLIVRDGTCTERFYEMSVAVFKLGLVNCASGDFGCRFC